MQTFRIDDVCLNTDVPKLMSLIEMALEIGGVMLVISPICFDPNQWDGYQESVFPPIYKCLSDPLIFANGSRFGVPPEVLQLNNQEKKVEIVSHGMFHGDHRLLTLETQRLSIQQSCRLLGATKFVPPWHKHNANTKKACKASQIALIKWGTYKGAKYHRYDPGFDYYFHSFDCKSPDDFKRWLEEGAL